MNPSFSSDWSREEKEEYATKRMNEMKLKNEKFKQRHAEVEKDRLEAEKKCSAVTSVAKILPKAPDKIEEKPTLHREPRKQREWDIGKSTNDNDWYPPGQQDCPPSQDCHDSRNWTVESDRSQQDYNRYQDYHHSRPPRRGGFYDKRRARPDNAWRSRGSRGSWSRGGSYRGSNQSRPNAFQSGNVSNYSRENNKNSFKTSNETSFKTSSNWNDSKRNAHYSGSNFPKVAIKSDSDKMWHDDGLNEVQNKQSRVEKWVKSINKVEDWSEGDEKPSKNYKNVGMNKSSENYQDKEQTVWDNERGVDSSTKKHFSQSKGKYEKPFEYSLSKNVSSYGDKISHASDVDHQGLNERKTSSFGHKRDNKLKYNYGASSYDKVDVSNLKNDPKIRKQNRYSKNKDYGADIWDYENADESKNKFSDSRPELDVAKHSHSNKNKNKDYGEDIWDSEYADESNKNKASEAVIWDYENADESKNKFSDSRPELDVAKHSHANKNKNKASGADIWDYENADESKNRFSDSRPVLDVSKHSRANKIKNKAFGADIWDYENVDESKNKFSDSKTELDKVKHRNTNRNRDSRSAAWDYKESDSFDSKTRLEVRKKVYNRKDTESDIWDDCVQINDSRTKDQDNDGKVSDVPWDYGQGDDWNNKAVDSGIESKVETHSFKNKDAESVGHNYEKEESLKTESEIKGHEFCDKSNKFLNVLTDNEEVKTSENYDQEEDEEYEDIYDDAKEISILTEEFDNKELDIKSSDSKHKVDYSNKTNTNPESRANDYCDISGKSAFVNLDCKTADNSKYELARPKAEFTEHICNEDSIDSNTAEQNIKISECTTSELVDSKAGAEMQECECNVGSNETQKDNIKDSNSKAEIRDMEEVPSLTIDKDSPSSDTSLISDLQTEISVDNSAAGYQSLSCENNEPTIHSDEKDKKAVIKDECNISSVAIEIFTINSNNSVSKLSESNELLQQQSICNIEGKDSQFTPETEDKDPSGFSEVSSEIVSCDIINKSSPVLSQENVKDDYQSSHPDMDSTESTKNFDEHETDNSALHLSDNGSPVNTESDVKILNNI